MKKFLFLLLVSLLTFTLTSCNDDDDTMDTIDTHLIKGIWEVEQTDHPDYTCIYQFSTQSENTWSWGTLTQYYLNTIGETIHNKIYDWHVSDPNNSDMVYLDITLKGDVDSEDEWENTERYIVEKISTKEMILKSCMVGDTKTRIRLLRRNDLQPL